MTKVTKLIGVLCLMWLGACSTGSGYNPELCESLVEKINSKTELTEKDYDQMIDQLVAINDWMENIKKETGDDQKAYKDSLNSPTAKKMGEYAFYFLFDIDKNKDKISSSSARKFNELMEKEEQENKN